jgi:prepilin-type N-terminal cleavage/methylation domain-containing protein
MPKTFKKVQQGFTIIEVLIVLAIAGLIMIIVFLAVPALQRNQRNQSSRTEANNLLSAAAEISANKAGAPVVATDNTAILAASNAKVITTLTIQAETGSALPTETMAIIRTAAKCNVALNETLTGTSRQIALLFLVETATATQIQCVNS